MTDTSHPPEFIQMIKFLRCFFDLREVGGGFMPLCSCGNDKDTEGTILLRKGEWVVRCPSCLAQEPADDRQGYDVSEVIALSLTKYGKRVTKEQNGDGWDLNWEDSPRKVGAS